jgi:two-component system phosphate regulon response regulator PhoB/two-component system alkaline phosphatase synthesis response regulator PhoP
MTKIKTMEIDQLDNNEEKKLPLQGKVILWVEDDILLTDIIHKKMQRLNIELLHAYDSVGCFKILTEGKRPDIIFLDILLPGMNGYEILEKLKANEETKDIPVIILSNFGQKSEIEKGMELGATKFLIKATMTLDEVFQEADSILKKLSI